MQTASDIFLGCTRVDGHDYCVRQFRDMTIIPTGRQISGYSPRFAATCGHALAKSHARSGDPEAIAGCIGKGTAFADGILGYAAQNQADHVDLRSAIAGGVVEAAERAW